MDRGGISWCRSNKIVYMQCYFVTIATILGTGVLGLPVTLAHSGLYPFLVSFLGGFIMQALLIVFFTDLLQKAYAVQILTATESRPESVPLNDIGDSEDFDDIEEEHETNGSVLAGHVIVPKNINVKPPNLHLMGELFLSCGVRQMFDIILFVQFISMLISYALAGSEAYAQVFNINYLYVIPVFVWVLSFAIVFALQIVQPLVAILTFIKGSLLVGTVAVTFFVGAAIHNHISNDISYVGAPFLMGTVALGGIVNVMPLLYSKIKPVKSAVKSFRLAVIMGLATCTILNVLWCWAILYIVPQTSSCFMYKVTENNSFHTVSDVPEHRVICKHNSSLEKSMKNGEIATIPLTEIIHSLYPGYDWVAFLVELFIMISITVSYLTIGAALHHTLSGWVESLWSQDSVTTYTQRLKVSSRFQCLSSKCVCRSFLSLVAFSLVFGAAMMNPKGFEIILEKAASLFMNLEAGVFIFLMLMKGYNSEHRSLKIPLPVPLWAQYLMYLIPAYFCFAVGYDVWLIVHDFITVDNMTLPSYSKTVGSEGTSHFIEHWTNPTLSPSLTEGSTDSINNNM